MPVLIAALTRALPDHRSPHLVTRLIGQCNSYRVYPGMGARILETIEAIESAA